MTTNSPHGTFQSRLDAAEKQRDELLAALQSIIGTSVGSCRSCEHLKNIARAAIAKASS